jgi:alpha-glucosidase (family GH31 glycosyl hydrolase)
VRSWGDAQVSRYVNEIALDFEQSIRLVGTISPMAPLHGLGLTALVVACACGCAAGDDVIVSSPAGRVVIARSPFALRVEDAGGHPALALVAGARPLGDTLYAPLAASLGDEPELAYPVLPGAPDTNPANPTPAQRFPAERVVDAHEDGGAEVVTLATSDPGRTVSLRVAAEGDGAFHLHVESAGATAISAAFASGADEAFHGFGGRRESTDLHGRQIRNWVLDYRYPIVDEAYYYVEPLFVSSRGYGLLLDQTENASFRLASDADEAWRVQAAGPALDLVVSPLPAAAAIGALTAITGRHRLPPAWSMGPTISRAREPVQTVADYQQAIADDLDRIQADALPLTAYCFEGWALLPDAFVTSTLAALSARKLHAVLYIRSFVQKDNGGTQPSSWYDQALANGWVATTKDGQPYLLPGVFYGSDMAVLDFTNPDARAFWQAQVRLMLDEGADGFMDDFGEQVLSDMVFADGSTGETMHNRYPVLQHQATREAVDAFVKDHPEREVYFFTRSGYTGRPGSAAYESATFPGDELAQFDATAGLASIVPDMLNRAVGGAWGFTTDIAGYADFYGSATKELYVRWSEAAALMPFFRVHNGPLDGPRMPWSFDAETESIWTEMAKVHQAMQPAFVSAYGEAAATGMPVVRPLWLADPGSASSPHNDDEWLVGADLLAAPVLEQGATSREVWLPAGCWQAHGQGAELAGGAAITVSAPLGELPWFQRCAGP